jgi:DNA mismatch endonuclease (patch repair protein)
MGFRYRLHGDSLPGRPDLVFTKQRLLVFCDGDFWHGRNLERRLVKLAEGHNAGYWVAKVRRNAERDRLQARELERQGWRVLRLWETDIVADASREALRVATHLSPQSRLLKRSRKKT